MKVVTWNIEWMNRWFQGSNQSNWGSNSYTEQEARIQAQKAANVINALSADILCIQEGPNKKEEMQLFIAEFLSDANGNPFYEVLIGHDGGAQKLYVLRRIDGAASSIDYALDLATLDLAEDWDADVNGDMLLQAYDFTRVPLVVDATLTGGRRVRIVVLHTKSKYVHRGESKWNDPLRRQDFIVEALLARRRISAEGFRLRTYLDQILQDDLQYPIIVAGDFNDGPGRDYFERSYLTHNVTDIVLGSTFYPTLIFDHPIIKSVPEPSLFTARFDDFVDDIEDRPLLLDHMLVSPALKNHVIDSGIAHAEFESEVDGTSVQRIERPSDHRPVWVEIDNNF